MIQPSALPGSYRHEDKTIDDIVAEVLEETQMIVDNGFDGVILQNMNDMPIKQNSSSGAIAYMTRIAYEIKHQYPQLILGVLVNWDALPALPWRMPYMPILCVWSICLQAQMLQVQVYWRGSVLKSQPCVREYAPRFPYMRIYRSSWNPVRW